MKIDATHKNNNIMCNNSPVREVYNFTCLRSMGTIYITEGGDADVLQRIQKERGAFVMFPLVNF